MLNNRRSSNHEKYGFKPYLYFRACCLTRPLYSEIEYNAGLVMGAFTNPVGNLQITHNSSASLVHLVEWRVLIFYNARLELPQQQLIQPIDYISDTYRSMHYFFELDKSHSGLPPFVKLTISRGFAQGCKP